MKYHNKISRELNSAKGKNRVKMNNIFKNSYNEYISHPTAQYTMTYKEFKNHRRSNPKLKSVVSS